MYNQAAKDGGGNSGAASSNSRPFVASPSLLRGNGKGQSKQERAAVPLDGGLCNEFWRTWSCSVGEEPSFQVLLLFLNLTAPWVLLDGMLCLPVAPAS